MGHNKIVAHFRKVKTGVGLRNVAMHNCRENVYDAHWQLIKGETLPEYISHPERAAMFEGDRCGGLAVLKKRADRIREAKLARAPQRNAASALEAAISASPEWFEEHKNPKEWSAYFKDARDTLARLYGKENILHWAVHYDEKTPHMHVLFVPLTNYKDSRREADRVKAYLKEQGREADAKGFIRLGETEELRYASGAFLGGRQGLRILHDELYLDAGKKRGLERGEEGSKARHTDQFQWAAENAKERDNLAMERGGLDIRAKDLDKREGALKKREQTVAAREAAAAAAEERAKAIHTSTTKLVATHPGNALTLKVGTCMYGLTTAQHAEFWGRVEQVGADLRASANRDIPSQGQPPQTRGPSR